MAGPHVIALPVSVSMRWSIGRCQRTWMLPNYDHADPEYRSQHRRRHGTSVSHLRQLIEYYLDSGYRFIGPPDLLRGLDAGGKYAMLTFDDGYYNNVHALPILQEYRVPAVFFISTNHVRQNKCFWWDVLHRERMAQGARPRDVYR